MITITDVAKAAGVSTATVSRVLHNKAVKPHTKEAVMNAIKELNYKPNALAQQLRTQKTKTVIVVVPDISNTFFSEILFGIEDAAREHDYQILIADMHNQPNIENYYFQAIQQRTIDGIISLSATIAKNLMEQIAEEYPIVVACQYLDNYMVPNVTIDNISAATAITEHLIQLGHTRIAHIAGDPNSLLYRDRFNGYIAALAKHNIPIDLSLVRYGVSSIQSGYDEMKYLLNQDPSISAVFAAGDIIAVGAINALKESGKRVPEDCAVVGFDDIEIASFWEPPLTTVRQPRRKLGQTAFRKLYKLMNQHPLKSVQDVLDYEIMIRESCGYNQNLNRKNNTTKEIDYEM